CPASAVASLLAAALGASTESAAGLLLAAEVSSAVVASAALVLRHGRGRVPQAGADLVDVQLEHGATLALLRVEGAGAQSALSDDAGAARQGLCDVLRHLAPGAAPQEEGLPVLPFIGLTVEGPRRRGHGEVRDGCAVRGEPQLRVGSDVPDDGDDCLACHGDSSAAQCVDATRVDGGDDPRRIVTVGSDRGSDHAASGRRIFVRRTDSLSPSWRSSSLTVAGCALRSTTT